MRNFIRLFFVIILFGCGESKSNLPNVYNNTATTTDTLSYSKNAKSSKKNKKRKKPKKNKNTFTEDNSSTDNNYSNTYSSGNYTAPTSYQSKSTSRNYSVRCQAITQKGTQCKRNSRSGNYCWQHGG